MTLMRRLPWSSWTALILDEADADTAAAINVIAIPAKMICEMPFEKKLPTRSETLTVMRLTNSNPLAWIASAACCASSAWP